MTARSGASGAEGTRLLIDDFMPAFDARERHATRVHASASHVFTALLTANLGGAPLVRALFALRALPAILGGAMMTGGRARRAVRLADAEALGFRILGKSPPSEIVLGVEGAFWTASCGLGAVDTATFRDPPPAGRARAAWNFHIVERGDGTSVLSTETRVRCADASTRRRFRVYWLLVRPGSALVRRSMLRSIRAAAERAAQVVAGGRR